MTLKRNAAIIGPTPETLYWSLAHPCPLRTLTSTHLAESSFQQLRSLRELSAAIFADRVVDGFALDRNVLEAVEGHELMGFSVSEVEQSYGGQSRIQTSCPGCPANAARVGAGWAGCFGLLPMWTNDENSWRDWTVRSVDLVLAASNLKARFQNCFPETRPAWYGMWINEQLSAEQCEVARDLIDEVIAQLQQKPNVGDESVTHVFDTRIGLRELAEGLTAAVIQSIPFHIHYAVAGISDGTFWRLPPHCGRCRFPTDSRRCSCCGASGATVEARSRRVLGRRPYLRLTQIVGPVLANQLAEILRNRQAPD